MPVERQVVSIYAGTNGYLDDIPVEATQEYEQELLRFIDENKPEVWKTYAEEKQLSDKLRGQLDAALKEFAKRFVPSGAKDAAKKKSAGA
jgi:F-type H+-transporting ATPase subunit alpha